MTYSAERDIKLAINTVEGKKFYENLGNNPILLPGQTIERNAWLNTLDRILSFTKFRMFINGHIKKLQLFWVDRQNKDKVKSTLNCHNTNPILGFYTINVGTRSIWSFIYNQRVSMVERYSGKCQILVGISNILSGLFRCD